MRRNLLSYCTLIIACFFISHAYATTDLEKHVLDENVDQEFLIGSQYLEDPNNKLNLAAARKSDNWRLVEGDNFNRGFNASTWWVRANLLNASDKKSEQIIEISYPILDYLDVFIVRKNGQIEEYNLGDKLPFYKRIIKHRNFVIPVTFGPFENIEVYFKAETQGSMQLPVSVWEAQSFYSMDQSRSLFLGIYFGIMLVMILYNLFIYFSLGERNYLNYVLFVSSITFFLASLSGYTFQYLWPHLTHWNDRSIVFFLALSVFFGVIFTIKFMRPSGEVEAVYRYLANALLLLSGSAALMVFFVSYSIMIRYVVIIAVGAVSTGLFIGVNSWSRGEVIGKYYTVSWSAILIGGLIFALSKSNILPQTILTDYAVQFGSAIQVLLLSFALAERISVERKLRYEAQEKVLENEKKLREAQNQILKTQKKTNELLELRVKERSQALEQLNEEFLKLNATDKLTGLKNRAFLDDILDKEISHSVKTQQALSVVLLDVDDFSQLNEEYGRVLGDECLKQIALKIKGCIQKGSDYTARYGGEVFCIVLPQTDEKGTGAVAERLRAAIEGIQLNERDKEISVRVSAGVATYHGDEVLDAHDFLKRADKALYKAKMNGKNQVIAWKPAH